MNSGFIRRIQCVASQPQKQGHFFRWLHCLSLQLRCVRSCTSPTFSYITGSVPSSIILQPFPTGLQSTVFFFFFFMADHFGTGLLVHAAQCKPQHHEHPHTEAVMDMLAHSRTGDTLHWYFTGVKYLWWWRLLLLLHHCCARKSVLCFYWSLFGTISGCPLLKAKTF